ncbi:MAG: hypothetical protein M1337_00405 [Actinobacteria bacterium]|nr:hypothetical protein [Actinomycetota bacterium]
MKILLLDLDDVLLEQRGYHRSLQQAVELIGSALGFASVGLSAEDIDLFEAVGVTSEWDSSAICAALLLNAAWEHDPKLRLPKAPPLARQEPHMWSSPDFTSFFRDLAASGTPVARSLERAEARLTEPRNPLSQDQVEELRRLLRTARDPNASLTHRLIQELNLGSHRFTAVYHPTAALDCQGNLEALDRPIIAAELVSGLLRWYSLPGHRAVIVTNRPSSGLDGHAGPPEAETGMRLVGLESFPFVAVGGLAWLAARRGLEAQALIKPSPVHVLTALRRAMGEPLREALQAAAALALDGVADADWRALQGSRIQAFDDSAAGMISTRVAADLLAEHGVDVTVDLRGVSSSAAKRRALAQAGATLYPDIATALWDLES